jgi:hypothetical protein
MKAHMPGLARRRVISDPQACELDNTIGLDPIRTFSPPRKRRDWTALWTVVAVVLVAMGCALVITAGQQTLLAINP